MLSLAKSEAFLSPVHAAKKAPLISFDICQSDGCLLAAGSELVGDEAHIMFW